MARLLIILTVLAAAAAGVRAQTANPALDKLFASAEHKATVQGDLKGAIEDYERIARTAGLDRAVKARALLRMADCYRSLGDRDAEQRTYRRVESDFPDQKEAVRIAARALAPNTSGSVVWAQANVDVYGALNTTARVSRDGRFITYTDWQTGNLSLHDIARNTDRPLTKDADLTRNQYAGPAAFSPDGRRIAFAWLDSVRQRYVLRIVGTTPQTEPQLLFDQEDVEWLQPYDWSLDGTRIAVQIQRTDGTGQIGLLDVADESLRVLTSFPWVGPSGDMRFTPDGGYLAFDQTAEREASREVFVIPSDGSCCRRAVVEHPGTEQVLGWAPGGSELLFWSNRSGDWSVWSIGIAGGKAVGSARLVRGQVHVGDAFASLGLTAAGDLLLATLRVDSAGIHITEVDFTRGRRVSLPVDVGVELANPFRQWTSYAWSPTGRTLAVFRRSATHAGVFSFKDYTTGNLREVRARQSDCAGGMVWSRDGRFLVCHGAFAGTGARAAQAGLVRVEVASGDARFLTSGRSPSLSPDSRTVYLLRGDQTPGKETAIVEFDLASGTERELLRRASLYALQVSPDGRHLVARLVDPGARTQSLLLLAPGSGEPRELLTVQEPGAIDSLFWSPDSRAVFARRSTSNGAPTWVRATLDGTITDHPQLDLGGAVRLDAAATRAAYTVPKQTDVAVRRIENIFTRPGSR